MTDDDLVAAKVEVFKFLKLVCNEVLETMSITNVCSLLTLGLAYQIIHTNQCIVTRKLILTWRISVMLQHISNSLTLVCMLFWYYF